jgi:hypothetical protein
MITEPAGPRLTGVFNDPTTPDGKPSIAHYIKKILLVSDNDASNRLYEFLGQQYVNATLQRMGFGQTEIRHRLSIPLSEAENRLTNPLRFYDTTGNMVYEQAAQTSNFRFSQRNEQLGKGFYRGGQLVQEPFDFSTKNRLTLPDLHAIVKSVCFPQAVPAKQRFNLTPDDYRFVWQYMSQLPSETRFPEYDTAHHWDAYVKFFLYGSEKGSMPKQIRIFNKVGEAYGFLIDAAYIVDFDNKIEFMLSAVISCNSDGIYNDDQYDYDNVGFPFFKHLGQMIYDYERTRPRKVQPQLDAFKMKYEKE